MGTGTRIDLRRGVGIIIGIRAGIWGWGYGIGLLRLGWDRDRDGNRDRDDDGNRDRSGDGDEVRDFMRRMRIGMAVGSPTPYCRDGYRYRYGKRLTERNQDWHRDGDKDWEQDM